MRLLRSRTSSPRQPTRSQDRRVDWRLAAAALLGLALTVALSGGPRTLRAQSARPLSIVSVTSLDQLDITGAGFAAGEFQDTVLTNGVLELRQSTPNQYVNVGTWESPGYDFGKTSLWGWFSADQPLTNFPNLQVNGSFETDVNPADGIPDGWSYSSTGVRRDTQHATDGQYSLRIDPPDFPSGGAYHTYGPPIPAAGTQTWHLLFKVSGDVSEAGFGPSLGYYNTGTRQFVGGIQPYGGRRYAGSHFADGTLVYLTGTTVLPQTADSIRIDFGMGGHGPLWVDEVSIFQVSRTLVQTRTSNDGTTWTAWERARPFFTNQIGLASVSARYLQYRLFLTSDNPTFSPGVNALHQTFARAFPVNLPYRMMSRQFFSPPREPTSTPGAVRAVNDHLEFEDGSRAKFWSAQDAYGDATGQAPIGTSCSLMEAMGFNLLKMDVGAWDRLDYSDPTFRDRFDQIIRACGDKGIYLYLRLYIEKRLVEASTADPDYEKLRTLGLANEFYFDPAMQTIIRNYITELLTHLNPYTQKKLGADPTITIIELFNEVGLIQAFFFDRLHGSCLDPANPGPCQFPKDIGPAHATTLTNLWNAWLRAQYADRAALAAAWQQAGRIGLESGEDPWSGEGTVARILYSLRDRYSRARFRDTILFYVKVEEDFYTLITNHVAGLRASDGVKTLVVGTQTLNASRAATKAELVNDVVDIHTYIDLEDQSNRKHRLSQAQNPGFPGVAWSAKARSLSKPFTMSEHNQTGYTDFSDEMPAFAGSYGAFQDYDLITVFALNNIQVHNNSLIFNFDPIRWFQMPAAANLFLRDVQPARTTIRLQYTANETLDIDTDGSGLIGLGPGGLLSDEYALLHGIGVADFGAATVRTPSQYIEEYGLPAEPVSPYVSDTGQLTFDGVSHVLAVNTAGTQGVVGNPAGMNRPLSNFRFEPDQTSAESWSVFVTATDTANIADARSLLLTATGRSELTSQRSSIDRRQATTFGTLPALASAVAGTVTLTLGSTDVAVTALDPDGNPKADVPVTVVGTTVRFRLDPAQEALWYRIDNRGLPTPLAIADGSIRATDQATDAATITWTTNIPADSQVEYGATEDYGSVTPVDSALVTNHRVLLSGLAPDTDYHFHVRSRSQAGETAVSADQTFRTLAVPPALTIVDGTLQVVGTTVDAATITWETSLPADGVVEYGLTNSVEFSSPRETTRTTSHRIELTGLLANTRYYFRVRSRDALNREVVSPSQIFGTATPTPPPAIEPPPPADTYTPAPVADLQAR